MMLAPEFMPWSTNLDWTHKLTQRWSVVAGAGVTQLMGDAADSPIVQRKNLADGKFEGYVIVSDLFGWNAKTRPVVR